MAESSIVLKFGSAIDVGVTRTINASCKRPERRTSWARWFAVVWRNCERMEEQTTKDAKEHEGENADIC